MAHEVPLTSVLLIDGHPEGLLSLESTLAPLGHRLRRATSGEEALQCAHHEDFAVILLAVYGREELETIRLLRELRRSRYTPVLLLTGSAEPSLLLEGHAQGAVDCVTRPQDPALLRAKVSAFVALHRRTRELRRAEAALAEREERLRFILEAGGLGHWRLELATMRLEASEGCRANFRLPPEAELSSYEALRSLIHPEDRSRVAEAVERAILTRTPYVTDYRVVPPGGGVRWVSARGRVECGADGAPIALVGITVDVTERMRSEEKFGFLSEASRLLTESMDPGDTLQRVARLATSSLATYCMVDLLQEKGGGLRRVAVAHREPALEELIRQLPCLSSGSGCPAPLAEVLRQGWTKLYTSVPSELRRLAAVNPEHLALMERLDPRSMLLVPMQARGRQWGVITFARAGGMVEPFGEHDVDTGEELARRATIALENARLLRTTQEAVRLRDEFLSVASHELKTPLTPLSLKLQSLARAVDSGGLPAVAQRLPKDVELMRRQVRRLSDLVNDLLDVSRIGTGRLKLELEQVDLAALVGEVVFRFEPEAERAGCHIELGAEGTTVGHWDRLRLEQVVSNLLSNAIKYGAGKPIRIQIQGEDAHARLVIRDEGIGVEPEAIDRIFGKFERAVSERNYGGLGLGLFITRQIVEALGGTIQVESTPGRGATFTTVLPRVPGAQEGHRGG